MKTRRPFAPGVPLRDRLVSFAEDTGERAAGLPPGNERDELLRKARQADTVSRDDWANSPPDALPCRSRFTNAVRPRLHLALLRHQRSRTLRWEAGQLVVSSRLWLVNCENGFFHRCSFTVAKTIPLIGSRSQKSVLDG
jgi:hypothetical protein